MWKKFVIAWAVVAAAGAHAQTKKELVDKVLELQRPGIEGTARVIASQTSTQVLQAAAQALTRVPAERREEVGKQIQADVRAFYNEVEPELRQRALALAPETMGTVFEERFSEEELKQLVTWFESPLARKYQQSLPELQTGLAQRLVSESRAFMDPKFRELQLTLRQRLAPPAAAAPGSAPPAPAAGK